MSSTVTWIVQGTQRSRHCLHKVPELGGGALHTSQILFFSKSTENTSCSLTPNFRLPLFCTQINVQHAIPDSQVSYVLFTTVHILFYLYNLLFIYHLFIYLIFLNIYFCCVFLGCLLVTLKTRMICLVNGRSGKAMPMLVGCLSQQSFSLLLFISTSTK